VQIQGIQVITGWEQIFQIIPTPPQLLVSTHSVLPIDAALVWMRSLFMKIVNFPVYMPTGFTPGNDGLNDYYNYPFKIKTGLSAWIFITGSVNGSFLPQTDRRVGMENLVIWNRQRGFMYTSSAWKRWMAGPW
jgi:hypothetical protein